MASSIDRGKAVEILREWQTVERTVVLMLHSPEIEMSAFRGRISEVSDDSFSVSSSKGFEMRVKLGSTTFIWDDGKASSLISVGSDELVEHSLQIVSASQFLCVVFAIKTKRSPKPN
jgi:hypothetical protein